MTKAHLSSETQSDCITRDTARSSHYLRPSRDCGSPWLQIALSVVGEAGKPAKSGRVRPYRLTAWGASAWLREGADWDGVQYGTGATADEFWRWLLPYLHKGRCTWVWQLGACAGLTLLDFWTMLERGLWRLDGNDPCNAQNSDGERGERFAGMCVIEDVPTIIMARPSHGPGMVRWIDAGNLGVESWSGMADAVGIECSPVSAAVGQTQTPAELAAARSVGLRRWLEEWEKTVSRLRLGGLRSTAASQAWHGWRLSWMDEPILCHGDGPTLRMEREAMHSGRCEAFRLGLIEGPVYQLDFASHYPASAIVGKLPCRHKWTGPLSLSELVGAIQDRWLAIARVEIGTDVAAYPVQHKGLTIWGEGCYWTTLAGPELLLALASGNVMSVGNVALYEGGRPFDALIHRLWDEKEQAEADSRPAVRQCVKRLLNSLIGKTAQHGWKWVDCPTEVAFEPFSTWNGENPTDGTPCRWRSIAWHCQHEEGLGEHPDACPAIAAWVMSQARVTLWQAMRLCGYGEVYYVDTDSLFVSKVGFDRLLAAGVIGGRQLGALRVKSVSNGIDIRGHKHYITDDGIVCSGVPKDAAMTDTAGWSFWVPERLKDSLRSKRPPGSVQVGYRMPDARDYRHGRVQDDGYVLPFMLG